jgi:hypothetical protein
MLRYLIVIVFIVLLGCAADADPPAEACSLKPDPGPCKAHIEKFFYSKDSDTCEVFIWGGCDGTVPFDTLLACEQSCLMEEAPLTPVCEFEGSFYEIGDSWPVDCNTCVCDRTDLDAPPQIVCTEMVCGNSTLDVNAIEPEYPYAVSLKLGESKPIPGGEITFTEVSNDNRCPEGVDCITHGSAKVFLELIPTDSPATTLFIDYEQIPGNQADIYIYDLHLQLKKLLPQPPAEGKLDSEQYLIELLIDKNQY